MGKISISHIYVYGMIRKKIKGGAVISISDLYIVVRHIIRLPKKYQFEFIKELVSFKLLKRLSRDSYELKMIDDIKSPYDSLGNPLW